MKKTQIPDFFLKVNRNSIDPKTQVYYIFYFLYFFDIVEKNRSEIENNVVKKVRFTWVLGRANRGGGCSDLAISTMWYGRIFEMRLRRDHTFSKFETFSSSKKIMKCTFSNHFFGIIFLKNRKSM